nr:hypothetical protein [Armatimonas sp.]
MPEAPKLQSEERFVSISRASQLLESPERTVRRMAAKLADTDRQVADRGATVVRLVALASLMGKELSTTLVDPVADTQHSNGRQVADTLTDTKRGVADSGGQSESALVEQLRSELESVKLDREHWRGQAEKSLQLVDQAQQLQLVAERKVAELEGKVLPAVEQKDASSRADSPHAQESGIGGGITPPSQAEEPRPGFWSFLRRWW